MPGPAPGIPYGPPGIGLGLLACIDEVDAIAWQKPSNAPSMTKPGLAVTALFMLGTVAWAGCQRRPLSA